MELVSAVSKDTPTSNGPMANACATGLWYNHWPCEIFRPWTVCVGTRSLQMCLTYKVSIVTLL